jgi:hypothetical protein
VTCRAVFAYGVSEKHTPPCLIDTVVHLCSTSTTYGPSVYTYGWHRTVLDLVAFGADALQVLACVRAAVVQCFDVIDLGAQGHSALRLAWPAQGLIG